MFPREQRIRKTKDILKVLRQGTRRNTPVVACSFLSKPGNLSRITVIVDTKVSKLATVRNLLKRRTRAILGSTQLQQGDTIVRLRPQAKDLSFSELNQQIKKCLNPR